MYLVCLSAMLGVDLNEEVTMAEATPSIKPKAPVKIRPTLTLGALRIICDRLRCDKTPIPPR